MSLTAGRVLALRGLRPAATAGARRNVMVVPSLGTRTEMRSEMFTQMESRVAAQKAIAAAHAGEHQEEVDESWKWLKISLMVAAPLCILSSFKDIFFADHEHRKPDPLPDYMKIRNKPYSWECDDCALFDRDCWKKCRAEKAVSA